MRRGITGARWIKRMVKAGRPLADTAVLSCQEVADIMTARGYPMTHQRVMQLERQAMVKLRRIGLREEGDA